MSIKIEKQHFFLSYHFYLISIILGIVGSIYPVPSIICIFLILYFIGFKKFIKLFLTFICIIFILKSYQKVILKTDKIPLNIPVMVKARVKDITTYPGHKAYIILKDVLIKYKDKVYKLNTNLLLKLYNSQKLPLPGQKIKGKFKIKKIESYKNPHITYGYTYRLKNIFFVIYSNNISKIEIKGSPTLLWRIRKHVKNRLLSLTTNCKNRGIILALLIGERSYIGKKEMELLKKASLAHLIAQSGLHVGFVAMIGFCIPFLIGYIYPEIFLNIPRQKLGVIIASIFVLFFLIISEVRPSLMRAGIMFFSWATLYFYNHKYAIIDGIAISIAILIFTNPYSIFDIGIQLSYISVLSIIIFYPYIEQRFVVKKIFNYLISIFIISFIINISILPILSYYFGYVSLSFYTNLIFIPAIGFIIFPTIFTASILSFFNCYTAKILFSIGDILLSFLMKLLFILNKNKLLISIVTLRPDKYMLLGYYFILFSIILILNKNKKAINIALIGGILLFIPPIISYFYDAKDTMRIRIFDMKYCKSILITEKGKRILIDGGGSWRGRFDTGRYILSPVLTYTRFPVIDKIILTKNDMYHIGGLFFIVRNYKINDFYYNGVNNKKSINYLLYLLKNKNVNIHILKKGDVVRISDDLKFKVLNPDIGKTIDNSIVLQFIYKEYPVLFISTSNKNYLLKEIAKLNIKSKVTLFPLNKKMDIKIFKKSISVLSPSIIINNCGHYKSYMCIKNKLKDFLNTHKIQLYDTYFYGCIDIEFKNLNRRYRDGENFITEVHYFGTSQ